MPYLTVKFWFRAVMKVCANREIVPLLSVATPMISLYQGPLKGLNGVHVDDANGTLSNGSALFHERCWSKIPFMPDEGR